MNTAAETLSAADLKARIATFVRRASIEVTTQDESALRALSQTLSQGTQVYVAHTPKATFEDVIRVSIKIQSSGLRASPHLVARRLPSERALREGLLALRKAGVEQALLVAGDCGAPQGPFGSSLDVLASRVFAESGLHKLGVGGHPEGHPAVETAELWHSLRTKQAFAERTGIAVHVVTQFGFDPQGVRDWADQFDAQGIDLPIHVGIAGPTSLSKLLRFAMHCGVRTSMRAAAKNVKAVTNVARMATSPEDLVSALVSASTEGGSARIVRPHFFTFGSATATANWIREVADGEFHVRPDGSAVLESASRNVRGGT